MIDSLSIDHWHHTAGSLNHIEVTFWTKPDGEYGFRRFTPTETSLARLMSMVWRHTLHGDWVMIPCAVGNKEHWSYTVEPKGEVA